mmetsp:Transcript_800/g.799  ORF Transcript_800/g.799 Transcript_800/m.799 type:complete len:679 (+) Transcript_800:19-2055(+)
MSQNIVEGNYSPSFPPERALYESFWKYVNPNGNESLPGSDAVPFFQKSEVDVGILRQIWSLSTVNNIMKKENFFTALRYITMVQNGDFPLTQEKLISSSTVQFPPPKFKDVQLPPAAPALPPPQAYAMTPEEQTKYLELFKTYDQSKTGLLSQSIIMPIFLKSNLPAPVINSIWALSDVDKDHMLSPIEFAIAFHLILCLSKKHLPLPPGLPAPLLALASTPVATPAARAPAATQAAQPPKQSVTSAFSDSSLPEPVPRREPEKDISEIPVPKSSDSISSGSLKYLLQRVVTEKISLSASITNSEADIEAIKGRLSTSISEINGIESEIEAIRNKLLEAYHIRGAIQFDEARNKMERDRLSLVVTEGKREIARLTGDPIEPSPLLGQFGEKIAITAADGIRQATNVGTGSGEVVVLNTELDNIKAILNDLTSERSRLIEDTQHSKQSLTSTQSSISTEKQNLVKQKQDLESLKIENQKLQDELDRITRLIASQTSIQPTTPVSVATPTPIQISKPNIAVVNHDNGFESANFNEDAGFGFNDTITTIPNNNTTANNVNVTSNDGFDNPGFGSTNNSGFDSFHTTNQSGFGGDDSGFGGFDNTDGSFDSFNSGFDAFGAKDSHSTITNPTSTTSTTTFSNSGFGGFDNSGFDAFGTTASASATTSSIQSNNKSGFDAFDF